ncbi:hypothetical protein HIM_00517 [Hirsutella minnesotensis 3608]|nr:hypothetical protein HIM_00517 [Hirsutella minnesotensis 3608]
MLLSSIFLGALWLGELTQAAFLRDLNPNVQYDYIIVGSGAGGSPLAARLASYGHSVLLLDAGDDQTHSYQYRVPALHLAASEYVPMTWNYFVNHYPDLNRQQRDSKMVWTLPNGQEYVGNQPLSGAQPKGVLYPRAGTFGGCTAHNAMITSLPDEEDWSYIVNVTGDASWSPQYMRTLFQRLENCNYSPHSMGGHGFDGWLHTSVTSLAFSIMDFKLNGMVLGAASALGKSLFGKIFLDALGLASIFVSDLNSDALNRDRTEGLFQVPLAINNGVRSGPTDFVKSVMATPNARLDVLFNSLVTRIELRRGASGRPRAQGVWFARGQSLYRADPRASYGQPMPQSRLIRANKEVIISAGAFNSPQLLKLSGIGPRQELQQWGIPVTVDLPGVGTNLQDRYENTVVTSSAQNFTLVQPCTFLRTPDDPCLQSWLTQSTIVQRGGYTSSGIALAVLKKSSVAENDIPDLFIAGALAQFTGYFPNYSATGYADARHWTWIILKAHTRNRAGTVQLRSTDPRDTPIINFNYFESGTNQYGEADKDAQALAEGLDFARKATANINHVPFIPQFTEDWPGSRVSDLASEKQWARDEAWGHHASCTCPIGAANDPSAVLDSRFRVLGVDSLRVVDASVFPKIPGYFIVLPVYMVSEKAADVIHQDSPQIQPLTQAPIRPYPPTTYPTSPYYNRPSYNMPSFQMPSFQMPSFQMPTFRMPTFQMPTFQMPTFQMPTFQMPSFRMPSFQMPSWGMPTFGMPRYY